jgi:hypothetical protein
MIYYFLSISNVVYNFFLQLLNQIVSDLSPEHPIISTFRPLREFLGHSPFQVALFMIICCVEALIKYITFPQFIAITTKRRLEWSANYSWKFHFVAFTRQSADGEIIPYVSCACINVFSVVTLLVLLLMYQSHLLVRLLIDAQFFWFCAGFCWSACWLYNSIFNGKICMRNSYHLPFAQITYIRDLFLCAKFISYHRVSALCWL